MTNIRGKNPYPMKLPFDDLETLNECCNCDGCLCEEVCKKYEDDNYRKKVMKNE